ncbi:MAG TPA: DUF2336 domain-containing protein [Aestuariivirgaceae bacterium]|nr:DUF2336 domain-containing protein [Aestuariivirgaceae bacterium]
MPEFVAWLTPQIAPAEAVHEPEAEDSAAAEPDTIAEMQDDTPAVMDAPSYVGEAFEPAEPGAPAERAETPGAEAGEDVAEPLNSGGGTAIDPELQSAETARTLLDIMAMPTGVQPQERALAGDTLLRLVSRMPVASLIGLCDRLCIMDAPPPLLVRRLIRHANIDVAGPLLERCPGISDQDLMGMIELGDVATLKLIARRRHLSPSLTDALIRHGDASVTIAVVRNPGAALSHEAFNMLAETAKTKTSLQAPLATRADTPAPIAFELFWTLPPQLRRYVLSRFLTESANFDRILKIAQRLDEPNGDAAGSPRIADKAECEDLISLIANGDMTEAARKLAALAGIGEANAQRIIADPEGEPLTVAMKAMGMSRTQAAAAAETLRDAPEAPLRSNRRIAELQNLFDSLSFTKARVLLTYWDWAVEQSGPYSDKAI